MKNSYDIVKLLEIPSLYILADIYFKDGIYVESAKITNMTVDKIDRSIRVIIEQYQDSTIILDKIKSDSLTFTNIKIANIVLTDME